LLVLLAPGDLESGAVYILDRKTGTWYSVDFDDGHLRILLETPLLAKGCRVYIHDLAGRLGLPVKASGLADGIEVFPRHNAIR